MELKGKYVKTVFVTITLALLSSKLSATLTSNEEDFSSKVISFLLVHDYEGAKTSCETALKIFPQSPHLKALYIKALSKSGRCDEALEFFKEERKENSLSENFELLEALSWGILEQKEKPSDMGVIASLIGAYLTHDAKAVNLLIDGMQSSNAFIRIMAIQLGSHYNDRILQKEILRLLKEEKNWYVRKELISSIGKMKLKEAIPILQDIVSSRAVTSHEKAAAIESFVMIHDDIQQAELLTLIKSQRAGLREMAVALIDHFEKEDEIEAILPLLNDSSPAVRMRMLAFFGSFIKDQKLWTRLEDQIKKLSQDSNYEVAIMANWVMLRFNEESAREGLKKWLLSDKPEAARFAASAMGAGGLKTISILEWAFHHAKDRYVKLNLARFMLEQKVAIDVAADYVRGFLLDKSEKMMFVNGVYPCFSQILPSEVRHVPSMPRYPEMVDQMTRLKLLNILAIVGVKDLKEIAKAYLQGQVWGVVGSAAVFFIQEEDMASIDLVRELLDDEDQTVRVQAALALAFHGGESRVASVLQEAYQKVDWDKKISILEAIGYVGMRESIPFLLDVLEEPFTLPRTIAASSILQCLYH